MSTPMSAKGSESRVIGTAGVTQALKDSPAVERALGRSKLYLLISWSLLYPEDDEFLDYLQSGEFVEDSRSALESLSGTLEGIGGERAKLKLTALSKPIDQIETWIAAECVNWQLSDLQAEHRRVFSNVITLDCPPYETLFGNDHVFAQAHVMGDIAGFYKAFGVELSRDIHERTRVYAFPRLQGVVRPLSRWSRQDPDCGRCTEKIRERPYWTMGTALLENVGEKS